MSGAGIAGHHDGLYTLSLVGGTPKILAYITPDEEQAMQDHGLVPA